MIGFGGTHLRISKCKSENLELCRTFWRHNIECFECMRVCFSSALEYGLGTIEN